MPNYRGASPRIRWGSGYTNAADIGAFDNPNAYPEPREGSDFDMSPSGVEDSWIVGDDWFLEGDVRWIPRDDSLSPKRAAGFNGSAGWGVLLPWARQKNILKFHPDARNLAVSPTLATDGGSGIAVDWVALQTGGEVGSSRSIDATEKAQKIILATGNPAHFYGISSVFWGIMPGEVLSWSAEVKGTYTGGGRAQLYLEFRDASNVQIGGSTVSINAQPGAYTRMSIPNRTAPAGTAAVHVQAYAFTPLTTDAATIFVRNVMVERASASSSSFIDNPSYDVYLTEPMKGAPNLENNKQRALHLKLRSATAGVAFDGY